jgi:hypothetical protein
MSGFNIRPDAKRRKNIQKYIRRRPPLSRRKKVAGLADFTLLSELQLFGRGRAESFEAREKVLFYLDWGWYNFQLRIV